MDKPTIVAGYPAHWPANPTLSHFCEIAGGLASLHFSKLSSRVNLVGYLYSSLPSNPTAALNHHHPTPAILSTICRNSLTNEVACNYARLFEGQVTSFPDPGRYEIYPSSLSSDAIVSEYIRADDWMQWHQPLDQGGFAELSPRDAILFTDWEDYNQRRVY